MNIEVKNQIAMLCEDTVLITDGSSAMDLLATVRYETGCSALVLRKEQLSEEFFRLSSGLAGEVLQKFVNYQMRLVIVGDYSGYTSKPLKDFIYESNNGQDVFFVSTKDEAVSKLSAV